MSAARREYSFLFSFAAKTVVELLPFILFRRCYRRKRRVSSIAMTVSRHGADGAGITVADRKRHLVALRQGLGERHPSTLAALQELMEAHRAVGDLADAVEVGQQLLGVRRDILGAHHPDSLAVAVAVANWRYCLGEFSTARAELERLLPILDAELGRDHVHALAARHTLAACPGGGGDPAAALSCWLQLFADEQRVLGGEHPTTLAARHNVAVFRSLLGDTTGAVDEALRVLAARGRVLGQQHPDTLTTRLAVQIWRGETGETAGAVAEILGLLPLLSATFGAEGEQTLTARHVCVLWTHDGDGGALDALSDWEVLVEEETRVLGAEHPLSAAGRAALAGWRARWEQRVADGADAGGRPGAGGHNAGAAAESPADTKAARHGGDDAQLLERIIGIKRAIRRRAIDFGADSLPVLTGRYDLAYALWEGGQHAAAEAHTDRLIGDCVRVLGEHHELTSSARMLLAAGKGL